MRVHACVCLRLKQPAGGGTSSNLQYLQPSKTPLCSSARCGEKQREIVAKSQKELCQKAALAGHCVFSLSFPSLSVLQSFQPRLKFPPAILLRVRRLFSERGIIISQVTKWPESFLSLSERLIAILIVSVLPQLKLNT